MSLREVAPEAYKAMQALERTIQVEPTIRHLIKVRASILNGCAYCVDMHTKLARKDGETEQRLYAVATWHEAPFFTPRERAALALTDEVTRIEGRVPRDVWDFAAKHFTPEELANLVWAIAAINTWNRVVVAMRTLPGTFQA
ncbi:MAG: carboxymuconolactone decarboxylase family protein [Myxococcaceae bacterium]|nr:carboxymuconolactone decarboxylase family protein [Myxococcaceae bacterium]